jgi:hypothetical protein
MNMSKLAVAAIGFSALAMSSMAQGTITFNNRITGIVDFKVSLLSPSNVSTFLDGSGYSVQLFVGAAGSSSEALVPVAGSLTTFRSGNAAGYFNNLGDIAIPGFAGGSTVAIQLRAWDNAGGTLTSYAAALAANRAVGSSIVVNTMEPLGGAGNPPATATTLAGLTAFNIAVVPEPGVMSLAAIGGLGLLALRRKNA